MMSAPSFRPRGRYLALVFMGLLLAACPAPDPEETPTASPSPSPTPARLSDCSSPPDTSGVQTVAEGGFVYLKDFPSTGLGNKRTLRVLLPPSYEQATRLAYPVLYMHDGQNLFNASNAAYGVEWQVDESVAELVGEGAIAEPLVVGIDNTGDRIAEYTPTADPDDGGGKGDLYADFVRCAVKPYIDDHFRTQPDAIHTAVAGSSLGGLISCYMAFQWPDTFGMAGCLSSSFWWDGQQALFDAQALTAPPPVRLWLDVGTGEGDDGNGEVDEDGNGLTSMVEDSRAMLEILIGLGMDFPSELAWREEQGAGHNETAWAGRFPHLLRHFYGLETPVAESLDLITYGSAVGLSGRTVLQLEANASFSTGLLLSVPNRLLSFETQPSGVAAVSATGEVTGLAEGETYLEASWEGLSDGQDIEVVAYLDPRVALTFDLTVPESTPEGDSVYIVGSVTEVGGWDPAAVPLTQVDATHWQRTILFPLGLSFEFKFTRGSWATVEKDAQGGELTNRTATADTSRTLSLSVARWADQ